MYAKVRNVIEELVGYDFKKMVTFEISCRDLETLPQECELTIKQYSPERNVDQNAKYWSIVSEIAKLSHTSKACVHNMLLADYGELEKVDGEPIEIVLPESFDYLNDRDFHLFPTGEMKMIEGKAYVVYYKLIDSKHMTKSEFSRLIDGAIYERRSLDE